MGWHHPVLNVCLVVNYGPQDVYDPINKKVYVVRETDLVARGDDVKKDDERIYRVGPER